MPKTTLALEGFRVLSVGHTYPGLYCLAILRDLGAKITRIERIRSGTIDAKYVGLAGVMPTESLKAGTSECQLDLKQAQGKATFLRMAQKADVILEGFRPSVADGLGIGYKTLSKKNPKLIYAAISGYGQRGAFNQRVGHDMNYLAETGMVNLSGEPNGPPTPEGVTVADCMAGVNGALNVLAAVQSRQRTKKGQFLDVAIVDGPLFLMSAEYEHHWQTNDSRGKGTTHFTGKYPWYRIYETKDHRYLSVGAVESNFYANLCKELGRPDLASKQFGTDEELQEVFQFFRKTFKERTLAEWMSALGEKEVCIAPVVTTKEALESPVGERATRKELGKKLVRTPVRTPLAKLCTSRRSADVLRDYGFTPKEVQKMQEDGAVGR